MESQLRDADHRACLSGLCNPTTFTRSFYNLTANRVAATGEELWRQVYGAKSRGIAWSP